MQVHGKRINEADIPTAAACLADESPLLKYMLEASHGSSMPKQAEAIEVEWNRTECQVKERGEDAIAVPILRPPDICTAPVISV
jgi:hypothetical protein